MLTQTYSFITNKITRSLNIFFGHSDDGLSKVKTEYIVKEK